MKSGVSISTILALALAGLSTAPALADSTSGSGAAYAVRVGAESVTLRTTFSNGQLILHVRNVGVRSVKVLLTPQCPSGSACGTARTLSAQAVLRDGDASRDETLALPSAARTFTWTITA